MAVLVNDKLAEVNNSIITLTSRVDEMETRIKELESEGDLEELRGEMQLAVNSVVADVNKEILALRALKVAQEEELKACRAEVESYKAKVEALEAQLRVCMAVVANVSNGGSGQASTTPKGNALQPPVYNGARNAREIDNFFWELEAYFGAVGIVDESQKVSNASFSLKDIALWWHRRCDDVKRGSDPITTWDEFKRELKKQFYPKDAEYEARAKLRRLQHQDGRIWEYVKEFQELLLEIPNMGEQDALFCFLGPG